MARAIINTQAREGRILETPIMWQRLWKGLPEPLQIALGMVVMCIKMAIYALVFVVPLAIALLILYWLVH